jgi:hypothetical protein
VSSKLIDIVSAAVAEETRSLWEQYDSEAEPWRRGRAILVAIGCGYLISQALLAATEIASGNIEQFFVVQHRLRSLLAAILFYLDRCSLDPMACGCMGRGHRVLLGDMGFWFHQRGNDLVWCD